MSPDELLVASEEILKEVYSALNYNRRMSSPDHTRHQFLIKPQLDKAVADFKSCDFKIEYLEKILSGVLLEKHYAKNVLALCGKLSYSFEPHYLYYLPFDELVKSTELEKLDFTKGIELVKASSELQFDAFKEFVKQLTLSQLIVMFEKMYLFYDKPKRYAVVFKEIYNRYGIKQNDSSERDEELFKELPTDIREFLENKAKPQETPTQLTLGAGKTRRKKDSTPLVINGIEELKRTLDNLAKKETVKKQSETLIKLPKFSITEIEGYVNSAQVSQRTKEILEIPLIPNHIKETALKETIELIVLFGTTLDIQIVKEDFSRLLQMRYYKQAIEFISIAFWYIDFSLDASNKERHKFLKEITDKLNDAIASEVLKFNSIYEFKDYLTPLNKTFLNETLFKV